jgi:hypothetical protein
MRSLVLRRIHLAQADNWSDPPIGQAPILTINDLLRLPQSCLRVGSRRDVENNLLVYTLLGTSAAVQPVAADADESYSAEGKCHG